VLSSITLHCAAGNFHLDRVYVILLEHAGQSTLIERPTAQVWPRRVKIQAVLLPLAQSFEDRASGQRIGITKNNAKVGQ
jgi:hypothetical protein